METNSKNQVGQNLSFATWKELLVEYFKSIDNQIDVSLFLKAIDSRIGEIHNLFENNNPEAAMRLMNSAEGNYIPSNSYEEIIDFLKQYRIGNNQFYTVYDSAKNEYLFVDEKVSDYLKVSKDEFSIEWFLDNSDKGFIHKEDFPHVIRWAGVAYAILSMPIFTFKVNQEYYKISFRPSSKISLGSGVQLIEKKSYLAISDKDKNLCFPSLHFDIWTCLHANEEPVVKPVFVSDQNQTLKMNTLTYLLNAYLMGFPTKYLLMLDERRSTDRNKDVANELNRRLHEASNIISSFSEQSVGDTFAKTIRKKVTELNQIWSFTRETSQSEPESITILKSLGLLPIPQNIKDLMYARVE